MSGEAKSIEALDVGYCAVTCGSKQALPQDWSNIDEAFCHHEVIRSAGSASAISEHLWNVDKEGAMLGR